MRVNTSLQREAFLVRFMCVQVCHALREATRKPQGCRLRGVPSVRKKTEHNGVGGRKRGVICNTRYKKVPVSEGAREKHGGGEAGGLFRP